MGNSVIELEGTKNYLVFLYIDRRSQEGHFPGQMEAANSFDNYNKAYLVLVHLWSIAHDPGGRPLHTG